MKPKEFTEAVNKSLQRLQDCREHLEKLDTALRLLELNGHQKSASLVIYVDGGQFTLHLTEYDKNYISRAVRGAEMVLLGAKKMLSSRRDAFRERELALLSDIESLLAEGKA